jgi:hypothetical protein
MRRRAAATGRRRGPSLAGTAARTAVVAGTVGAVKRGSAAREQASAGQASTGRASTGRASGAQASTADQVGAMITRLKELAELRDAGILTDAEFAAQKAKLLT